jgi:hypothetical protein
MVVREIYEPSRKSRKKRGDEEKLVSCEEGC